jgi:hypothetical protein
LHDDDSGNKEKQRKRTKPNLIDVVDKDKDEQDEQIGTFIYAIIIYAIITNKYITNY